MNNYNKLTDIMIRFHLYICNLKFYILSFVRHLLFTSSFGKKIYKYCNTFWIILSYITVFFFIFTSDDWRATAKKKVYSKSEPNYHFKKDKPNLQTAVVGHNLFSHTHHLYPFLFVDCGPAGQVYANNGFVFDYFCCCLLLLLFLFFPQIFSIKRVIKMVFFFK